MRKRLRKKLKQGEFRCYYVEVNFRIQFPDSDPEQFLRLHQAIDAVTRSSPADIGVFGCGDEEEGRFVASLAGYLPGRFDPTVREVVSALEQYPGVSDIRVGRWKDAWSDYNVQSGYEPARKRRPGAKAKRRRRKARWGLHPQGKDPKRINRSTLRRNAKLAS